MFRLVRELTGDGVVALVTGTMFTAVPYQFAHLQGHLHLLSMGWVPLYLVYLLRLLDGRGSGRDGILGGLFLGLASLASWYHLLYALVLTLVLLVYGLVAHRPTLLSRRAVRGALALGVTCFVLVGPLLIAILVTRAREVVTGAHDPVTFSADLHAFVFPNAAQGWCEAFGARFARWSGNSTENATYVGVTMLVLAAIGAGGSPLARAFLVAAVIGAVLALGPVLHVDGKIVGITLPYAYLERAVPVLAFTGVPVRFGYVMYLGLTLAAAFGLVRLRDLGERAGRLGALAAVVVPVALVLVEYRPRALITSDSAVPPPMRAWANDPTPFAVLDVWDSYRPMWHATIHRKPIVGGYLTRVPKRLEAGFQRHPVLRAIAARTAGSYWLTRRDSRIDFAWGDGSPDDTLEPDDFQVTWTGTLLVPATGTYQLWIAADDGALVSIDGRLLLRRDGACPAEGECVAHARVALTAGPHALVVRYGERAGNAAIHLWWQPPGGLRAIVPGAALRTASGTPGLDAEYEQVVSWQTGLGTEGGRTALRALGVRYVVTSDEPNRCVQEDLALPLTYAGEGVRIYEVPAP
jgi:hypothetical protein